MVTYVLAELAEDFSTFQPIRRVSSVAAELYLYELVNVEANEGMTGERCPPERRVLEDGLGKGLSQQAGTGLAVLADPGQVSAEVDQELVVGLRDAGRLQDPLQPLPALLHTLTLYKTETTPGWVLEPVKPGQWFTKWLFFLDATPKQTKFYAVSSWLHCNHEAELKLWPWNKSTF